ncbi:MAG TPA: SDR family NAD(P)-dependent oxidoreductase [Crocinitomicaceae bacterium]|nr:SDR family NAD(P)-dependent oxidoreductase [Crocinitomicaceae bacterium]
MNLQNKTAIVTGASIGLGLAISKALVQKGCTVYGISRSTDKLLTIQNELGNQFIPVSLDVSQKEMVKNWVNTTFSKTAQIDILINNAGIGYFGKIEEMEDGIWENLVNTNLNGMYYMTSQIVPFLKENTATTHIINIGSVIGKVGREDSAAYCATKFAVSGFSESLFKELRTFDIKVTCVNPGSIETNFFKNIGIEKSYTMMQPNDVANTIIHVLETPDNILIDEITLRPLNTNKP